MTRDEYWHDEYEKASKEYRESRAKFEEADNARAAAMATMNRAGRELNRLFALRFNTPGVTISSGVRALEGES